jgi:hypothetical protein
LLSNIGFPKLALNHCNQSLSYLLSSNLHYSAVLSIIMVKLFGLSGSALVATFLAVACSAVPAPQTPGAVEKVSYYRLKTKVIDGDHKKNNLYRKCNSVFYERTNIPAVQSYHTGAGLSDVSLTSNASEGIKGYLYNSTYQAFDLGTTFPWGLSLAYNQYYTRW